jgi:hypothetical protein
MTTMTEAKFDKFAYHKTMGAGLTDGEYRVLAVMWDYAKPDGTDIRPTHKVLAAHCGMGVRTVERHVASLRAKGWLHEDRPGRNVGRGGGAAKYRLSTPVSPANSGGSSGAETPANSGGSSRVSPANPDKNTRQSVQEHPPIRVGTPANTGGLTDKEQIKRTDQGTESFVSTRLVSNSPGAGAGANSGTDDEDGYKCSECSKHFDGQPPHRHERTRQPICGTGTCCPF